MNPNALAKARGRLRVAKQQLEAAEKAPSYEAFKDAWYLFLVAAKNVYTTLEQGSKASARSRQWFGGKKADRKADPLLQYLFQARDDDEHGLSDVTNLQPGHLTIGRAAPGYSNDMTIHNLHVDGEGKVHIGGITAHDNLPVLVEQMPGRAVLSPVIGRGNNTYDPPLEHLGKPLADSAPITVGKLCLVYLEALVTEAGAKAS